MSNNLENAPKSRDSWKNLYNKIRWNQLKVGLQTFSPKGGVCKARYAPALWNCYQGQAVQKPISDNPGLNFKIHVLVFKFRNTNFSWILRINKFFL